jgi:hypothetical protein
MNAYPFISLPHALIVLRVSVAILYMAHATVRIVNGTGGSEYSVCLMVALLVIAAADTGTTTTSRS